MHCNETSVTGVWRGVLGIESHLLLQYDGFNDQYSMRTNNRLRFKGGIRQSSLDDGLLRGPAWCCERAGPPVLVGGSAAEQHQRRCTPPLHRVRTERLQERRQTCLSADVAVC